ncbi:MAG TPA: hypothetical protein ENI97_01585 [Gammaproteobacteria bacterium]|nr:hypothetical protein [Gammaproteobacteria bacterium]
MTGPIIAAVLTYVLMLAAFRWHRLRRFHVSVMVFIICFDVAMPFYLVSTRDWGTRLIDHGDILSFGVWMHFGLIVTLYVLYVIQVQTALRILRTSKQAMDVEALEAVHKEHRAQGIGILLARGLVIITGGILAEPASALQIMNA